MSTIASDKSASAGSGGGPTIRLNLQQGQKSTSAAGPTADTSPPRAKKRRFEPPPLKPNTAQVNNLQILHQKTSLSFFLNRPESTSEAQWFANATTTLYIVDDSTESNAAASKANANSAGEITYDRQFALHLRGTCHVTSVEVETVSRKKQQQPELIKAKTTYSHFDPLEKILLKPAMSYTMDDIIQSAKTKRHEADSQSSRGAAGMTNAVRAAGIASNMGELRFTSTVTTSTLEKETDPTNQVYAVKKCWMDEIERVLSPGNVSTRLAKQMEPRSSQRKDTRYDSIASTLAGAGTKAAKITVRYQIAMASRKILHLGGIHALTTNDSPHIYTTSGVYGDYEGTRSWLPIADSASTRHRASHEIIVKVTAPMKDGLSVVGCGEDFGVQETLLHDRLTITSPQPPVEIDSLEKELGSDHVTWLRHTIQNHLNGVHPNNPNVTGAPHIIPPEIGSSGSVNNRITSIDSILATSVWYSTSWLPIAPRSLGFAIGPFRVLEDPEYFNSLIEDDDDDGSDDEDEEEKPEEVDPVQAARDNGEGVRQVFFSPIFARKHIHSTANMVLLPDTTFDLSPLTKEQMELSDALDQSVLTATIGVPSRALSIMRDILALPAFRTVSYTQIWIPYAAAGGVTSGSLHCCPEASNNPFLGGSIMDSRLLPPPNHRLPYHQGGRVLQFLQARCAVRGWITSAVPLGGRDDVGNGYIHTLIESLIMSLYERGYGANGCGGGKGSSFFTKRFAAGSGLNSTNLDFLPVQNIEESDFDVVIGGIVGAVPIEDRNNDQLWRSASNGTESHTSPMDEYSIRQLLTLDCVSTIERGTDKDREVPTPSLGWMGSHLSLSFLSSNANSSSDLGCGTLELQHPIGGLPYRALKGDLVRRVVEGRAGIANFLRLGTFE